MHALGFRGDDAALVAGILRGHPGAAAAFHDRFARRMHGLLFRLLGPDPDLEDVLHDAFVRALEALPKIRDPAAIDSWVMGVTVRVARTRIQGRVRRRWLRLLPAEQIPEPVAPDCDPATAEALRSLYRVLDRLPADDRIALVLRHVAGMTLEETAAACAVSLATIKRRLQRAEPAFQQGLRQQPALVDWIGGGQP